MTWIAAWIAARLHEKGTWAGLFSLVSLLSGQVFSGEFVQAVSLAGAAIGSALVVWMKERTV